MPSCDAVFWFVLQQSKDYLSCIRVFLLILFIYYSFRIWTSEELKNCKEKHNIIKAYFLVSFYHYPRTGLIKEGKKWNEILDECKEKHNIITAYVWGIFYYPRIRFRREGFLRIIALIFLLSLSFCFGCKGIYGYSFNDQQLYYWVFSTLAQVFGALIGLLVIIISTVILGYERISGLPLKCLENIKNDIRFSLYPSVLVLLYSIIFLSSSSFLIKYEFCRVIITIFGMEIPILAIDSLIPLIYIIEHCREESRHRHPRIRNR
jgi:hypothetical protein